MDVDRGAMHGGRGPGPPDGRLRRLVSILGRRAAAVASRPVRFEQAVYGSFAFWDQGYAVLARSPGCRDEWVADFRTACQKLGERPAGVAEAVGLFALRIPQARARPVRPGRCPAIRLVGGDAVVATGLLARREG